MCARRGDFPPLEEGDFYACVVEGARVVLQGAEGEREVGRVRALRTYPSTQVLVVDAADGGRPWEVPLVSEVVRGVDVSAGVVTLSTLAGVERE